MPFHMNPKHHAFHFHRQNNVLLCVHDKAVALLEQMVERRIQPDEVCYGATIAALSEVAASETRSNWGAGERTPAEVLASPPPTARNSGEEEEEEEGDDNKDTAVTVDVDVDNGNDDGDNAISDGPDGGAGSGSTAPAVVSMRAHEKAVALIQQMRQNGPRCVMRMKLGDYYRRSFVCVYVGL